MWAQAPAGPVRDPGSALPRDRPESNFANAADASYGIGADDFAKQMTEIHMPATRRSTCRRSSTSSTRSRSTCPPRPLLLTFDDARADSWTGADAILKKLHFTAVMFVDVGRVDGGDREYLTWKELESVQDSGRWQLQLHSGKGHTQIHYGPGDDDYGPFYAYKEQGEDFDGWQQRVRSDIRWGQDTLTDHTPGYKPLAFALPYGSYGQDGTNDPKIPDDLLGWLIEPL